MKPELVIFDCDGVLVDSEPISVSVLIETVAKAGIKLDQETVYDRFLGKSMTSICQVLSEEYGTDLSAAHLAELRSDLFARFRRELQPVPHMAEVLRRLRQRRCVASSSQPDRIRLSLEIAGLARLTGPDVFSAAMVAHGKPAPDLFLFAAEQMGVEPALCVVVEDSPPGIQAAQAAGMRVLAYQGASHGRRKDLRSTISAQSPDATFDDMRDLPALLARMTPRPSRRNPAEPLICAVDVGSSSARAAFFDLSGRMLVRQSTPFGVWREGTSMAGHDSEEVWQAVCASVRKAARKGRVVPGQVRALGFDATCSLVFRDKSGRPLSVSASNIPGRDTIAWHDHRAFREADECTALAADVLDHVGSSISPEMQIPKLLWVKRNLPLVWDASALVFDLADFMTWKATGLAARSQGPAVSKWMFMAHEPQAWRRDFLERIGLQDLFIHTSLPEHPVPVGRPIGTLSATAAAELGLAPGICVAAGLIDAHAGAIGLSEPIAEGGDANLALIAGTSNCIAVQSVEPCRFEGIWGPYFGAAQDGRWLSEAGQSATGALLDHLIRQHAAGGRADALTHRRIVARIRELRVTEGEDLSPGLHVLPDFNGNRSPLADPHARGLIMGADLDSTFDGLCRLYWRASVGIALGVRHMVDSIKASGMKVSGLRVGGGHVNNPVLMELYRDSAGPAVTTMPGSDAVLLGTAMSAAVAAGLFRDADEAIAGMGARIRDLPPSAGAQARVERDYAIFLRLIEQRAEITQLQRQLSITLAGQDAIDTGRIPS